MILKNGIPVINSKEYINMLKVNKALNITSAKETIHTVIAGDNILQSLLAVKSLAPKRYTNIFYRVPTRYDEKSNNSYLKTTLRTEILNTLTLAKTMLTNSGTIFIQVSADYLGIALDIADSLFSSNNRISTFIVNTNQSNIVKNGVADTVHYILAYAKNKSQAIDTYSYDIGKTKQFCTKQNGIENIDEVESSKYNFKDDVSEFNLYPFMRTSVSDVVQNSKSYYPIYYIPPVDDTPTDLEPLLYFEKPDFGSPVELLPIDNVGLKHTWNATPTTAIKMLGNNNLAVKNINGTYKLFYKSRPNRSDDGEMLSPIKQIYSGQYGNTHIGKLMSSITQMVGKYYGFNAYIIDNFISAFSKENDEILFIGDDLLTSLASFNVFNHNRIFTVISEDIKNVDLMLEPIIIENNLQVILYNVVQQPQMDTLQFIENFEDFSSVALFKYNCISMYMNTDKYSIRETPTGDVVVSFKVRYDIDTYQEVSDFIKPILQERPHNICIVQEKKDDYAGIKSDLFDENFNTLYTNDLLDILYGHFNAYKVLKVEIEE